MGPDSLKRSRGAGSGTRTHTLLRAADFESAASTDSAIPARARSIADRIALAGQAVASVQSVFAARWYHSPSAGRNVVQHSIGAL
jgi:hypothetical protein